MCGKGRASTEVLSTAVRLTGPLVRGADGESAPASWEEALDRVAAGPLRVRAEEYAPALCMHCMHCMQKLASAVCSRPMPPARGCVT
ncbi:hypothetical protein ACIO6U_04000 [Streptomyces sp. NPDC087422]|uniref:hypothetical protein n=1 Tax=Streptomyces sp. NPDC087422 TaxID=3365786 RepID=UPI0038084A6E